MAPSLSTLIRAMGSGNSKILYFRKKLGNFAYTPTGFCKVLIHRIFQQFFILPMRSPIE